MAKQARKKPAAAVRTARAAKTQQGKRVKSLVKPAARVSSSSAAPRAAASSSPRFATIKVASTSRESAAYEVRIGSGILAYAASDLIEPGCAALVVVDSRLGNALIEPLLRALDRARVRWGICVVSATEADKSLATAERALAEAGRIRLGRDGLVIAVGGGIVCDVGGFVAAVFARGVRVVQCPTSLLAMVDAAVGGKTAVNLTVPASGPGESDGGKHRLVKNAVGVFHQPVRVVCDVAALHTLPRRELRCGLAECIKHGLIAGSALKNTRDRALLDWTEANLARVLDLDEATLIELVKRNVTLKAAVVESDPFELGSAKDGGRMMLNLGHTFGHALETLPGLSWPEPGGSGVQIGPLKHGEAVALGLLAAARVSEVTRLAKRGLGERIHTLLHQIGLPTGVRGLPESHQCVERMLDDKKSSAGRLRLVLPCDGMRARVVTNPASEAVLNAIDAIRT